MNILLAQDYYNKIAGIRALLDKDFSFHEAIKEVGGDAQLKLGIDEDGLPALLLNYDCLESFLRDHCFKVWQAGIGDTQFMGKDAVLKVLEATEHTLDKVMAAYRGVIET